MGTRRRELVKEIKEGFLEEMTLGTVLKLSSRGRERRHSRHRQHQVHKHRSLGKDGPFRQPIDPEGEKGIMAAETGWSHVQSGSQEGLCTKLGTPCRHKANDGQIPHRNSDFPILCRLSASAALYCGH